MTETVFAQRTQFMKINAIREILKVASRPDIVSLAGGLPASEAFPMRIMPELTAGVFEKYGSSALQYDRTEGFEPLRQALAGYLSEKKSLGTDGHDLLIASGSQGVLDALGKILISPGDRVAVESPTYLGAIQAFNPYQPKYVSLETDDEGVIPESLESALRRGPIKLLYLVPNFQNPTGRTLTLSRRLRLAEILESNGILLIEDDSYGDLRYEGNSLPPIQRLAPEHVVYIGTLSKVFAPGLRLGYCIAPKAIRRWLVMAKQGVDLHTSSFCQAIAAEYIAGGYLQRHLPTIIDCYRSRRDAMIAALDAGFPGGMKWSRPEGGMFVWVEGPASLDAEKVYEKAVAKGVAFVPGRYFFAAPDQGRNTFRLNFTMPDESTIHHAIRVLSELLQQHFREPKVSVGDPVSRTAVLH